MAQPETPLIPCKYGMDCYRQNPLHFHEFSHPENHPKSLQKRKLMNGDDDVDDPHIITDLPGKRQKTGQKEPAGESFEIGSNPKSHYRFTRVTNLPNPHSNSNCSSLSDLLSYSKNMERSLHFNYLIDIAWLIKQYPSESRTKPILLIHGNQGADKGLIFSFYRVYQ